MTPVRLEPVAPRSRVKHSTTEPLRSLNFNVDKIESNIRAPVSLNLLNSLRKSDKIHIISPTCLINSIKHEHSCNILYLLRTCIYCIMGASPILWYFSCYGGLYKRAAMTKCMSSCPQLILVEIFRAC